jgi:sulfide dehydrogenase cytochrome subunit
MAGDLESVVADCNGCHGDDGVSQWTDVPTIAGVPEFVHSDALYIFRDEARPCSESQYKQGDTSKPATTMCAVTADLSDDMIDEIAAYYAGLPFVAAKQDFDAALAEAGKAVGTVGRLPRGRTRAAEEDGRKSFGTHRRRRQGTG